MLQWLLPGKGASTSGDEERIAPIPQETLGLKTLYKPEGQIDVDIVAVHGLGGDSLSTWTSGGHVWLRDFLPQALKSPPSDYSDGPEDSKAVRVMTFGYDANVFTKASTQRSFTFAENLLSELKDRRSGEAALIIAHSRPKHWGSLLKSVVHLCFFGTPHQGTAATSKFMVNLGSALTRSKEGSVLRELDLWSPTLLQANQLWVEIANGFSITSFFEREPYKGIMVVPEGSARLNRDNETVVPMDRNHINICKFSSAGDPMFLKVFSRLHAEIAAIGTLLQVEEQAKRIQNLLEKHDARSRAEDQEKILKWLDPPETRVAAIGTREPGTNEWFLQGPTFHNWLAGNTRFLFVHGPVGCGKSVLWKSSADYCQRHYSRGSSLPESSLASIVKFMFSSTMNTAYRLNDLLRHVIAQLSPLDAVPSSLQKLYERCNKSYPPVPPEDNDELIEVLNRILAEMRSRTTASSTMVYVLIDGLDEIRTQKECRNVTEFLNGLATLGPDNLSILVTSRPLQLSAPWNPIWEQFAIPALSVAKDIQLYVSRIVTEKLGHLSTNSKESIVARLAGPTQDMFRYADLQLQTLLDSPVLRDVDIEHTLDRLPSTLNETYDCILDRLSIESHKALAKTALSWLVAAYQPLSVSELSEACAVRLGEGGQIDNLRLKPAELASLLRHLVVFEEQGSSIHLASHQVSGKDYVVFAHFSVKEYLLNKNDMRVDLRQSFALDLRQAHLDVAGSCIAYLTRTNTMQNRLEDFPLRLYAWDLWAFHVVTSTASTQFGLESRAKLVLEKVAFGRDDSIPADLEQATWWTASKGFVLQCLRNPYFFDEYAASGETGNPACHVYSPTYEALPSESSIRLLYVHPNQHKFAGIRCSLRVVSLDEPVSYEAMSYLWGTSGMTGCVWVNGQRLHLPKNAEEGLRVLRGLNARGRHVWLDSACIDHGNAVEKSQQVALMPSIFSAATSVTISLKECSDEEIWALEIIDLINELLEEYPGRGATSLSTLLRSRAPGDPFVALECLFNAPYWSRAWVLQEAVLGQKLEVHFGTHPLPFSRLQSFVTQAEKAFQLIIDAGPNFGQSPAVLVDSPGWEHVVSLIRLRHQRQHNGSIQILRLIYETRNRRCYLLQDRFFSLAALLPPGAPHPDYSLSSREVGMQFSLYAILSTDSLDFFTLLSLGENDSSLPSWAGYCRCFESENSPQPLLLQELRSEVITPFCAGGRQFRSLPTIDETRLHLEGFLIDTIEGKYDALIDMQGHKAYKSAFEYANFAMHRQCFMTRKGLTVLGPVRGAAGDILTILVGGKTPFLLRPIGEHYILIGECWVTGLMLGEFMERPTEEACRIILV